MRKLVTWGPHEQGRKHEQGAGLCRLACHGGTVAEAALLLLRGPMWRSIYRTGERCMRSATPWSYLEQYRMAVQLQRHALRPHRAPIWSSTRGLQMVRFQTRALLPHRGPIWSRIGRRGEMHADREYIAWRRWRDVSRLPCAWCVPSMQSGLGPG